MYEKEIELVDSVMEDGGVWSHKRAAWYTIREALKQQLQNTSSNSDYEKCLCEDCKNKECEGWEGKVIPEDFVVRKCKGHCT